MAAPPDHQLLFFYTLRPDGDEKARMIQKEAIHCAQGVEKDIGSELIRLNLYQNPRNEKIFHAFSHRSQICTGTPYFFNKTNGEYVCGYSTCDEILMANSHGYGLVSARIGLDNSVSINMRGSTEYMSHIKYC